MMERNIRGEVLDRGKYGYAVSWRHTKPFPYESSMPDIETAKICVAAPRLLQILEVLSERVTFSENAFCAENVAAKSLIAELKAKP